MWICLVLIACETGEKEITKQPEPKIPPAATKETLQDGPNAIQIRLSATKDAMVEGSLVDETTLKDALVKAKQTKGDTATVVLHLKGDTEYGMFTAVHQTLEQLLQEERDSVAHMRFNIGYENLTDAQRAVIKRKHHLRIIEKMQR
jgi:biopolymer transport protein ExbD